MKIYIIFFFAVDFEKNAKKRIRILQFFSDTKASEAEPSEFAIRLHKEERRAYPELIPEGGKMKKKIKVNFKEGKSHFLPKNTHFFQKMTFFLRKNWSARGSRSLAPEYTLGRSRV